MRRGWTSASRGVSIRAPAWGATKCRISSATSSAFQFALPRGERRSEAAVIHCHHGFNSRSRVGSDPRKPAKPLSSTVSIRAPAWGATRLVWRGTLNEAVSIRAPAWGATCLLQYHLHAGKVSIRAPAWGATCFVRVGDTAETVSIRAPAWGATSQNFSVSSSRSFQFALPRGERRPDAVIPVRHSGFNSRPRVGSD